MSRFLNAAVFQAGWFASILCAANGMPWMAVLAVLAVVALHLALAPAVVPELKLVLSAALIGILCENALVLSGLTAFQGGALIDGTAPLWMVAQWMLFATTLNLSLSWLKGNLPVAALFGVVGAPLSYMAGERLGALQLVDRESALMALAVGWAVLTPLLMLLARRWDGRVTPGMKSPPEGVQHA